eukprot:365057-Chlamydomonas_euryale.AAC.4
MQQGGEVQGGQNETKYLHAGLGAPYAAVVQLGRNTAKKHKAKHTKFRIAHSKGRKNDADVDTDTEIDTPF